MEFVTHRYLIIFLFVLAVTYGEFYLRVLFLLFGKYVIFTESFFRFKNFSHFLCIFEFIHICVFKNISFLYKLFDIKNKKSLSDDKFFFIGGTIILFNPWNLDIFNFNKQLTFLFWFLLLFLLFLLLLLKLETFLLLLLK